MIDLLKLSQTEWYVTVMGVSRSFPTIEAAADHLIKEFDVNDDDIDTALIKMTTEGHNEANFTSKGKLIGTKDLYAKRK